MSFQGSIESLKDFSEVAHFTHYTVAHAHLGAYGFVTMIFFGLYYYMIPRLTGREWASSRLIRLRRLGLQAMDRAQVRETPRGRKATVACSRNSRAAREASHIIRDHEARIGEGPPVPRLKKRKHCAVSTVA